MEGRIVAHRKLLILPKEAKSTSLPFASFFSNELNFKKEWVTPTEGKAVMLTFMGFFSSKLALPKEKTSASNFLCDNTSTQRTRDI